VLVAGRSVHRQRRSRQLLVRRRHHERGAVGDRQRRGAIFRGAGERAVSVVQERRTRR